MEETRDRELTLGPVAMIGLALTLCAICVVFFLWGYSIGHRSPADATASPAGASGPTAAQLLSGNSKPAPTQSGADAHADGSGSATSPAAANSTAASAVSASYPAANSAAPPGNPAVVQAALPSQTASSQAVSGGQVQPALGQSGAWMVQIAAVSHSEDSDVLVSALRKRGYVVSARRDPTDNLLHVQVGPFATHADAASMRQRLLNDGYNAIIEP